MTKILLDIKIWDLHTFVRDERIILKSGASYSRLTLLTVIEKDFADPVILDGKRNSGGAIFFNPNICCLS